MRFFLLASVVWGQISGLFFTAESLRQVGRYGVAVVLYDSLSRVLQREDSLYLRVLLGRGKCLISLKWFEQAERILQTGDSIALGRRDTVAWLDFRMLSGELALRKGLFLEAQQIFEEVGRGYRSKGLTHSMIYGRVLRLLGEVYHNRKLLVEAESLYLASQRVIEEVVGQNHAEYGYVLRRLGVLYYTRSEYKKAEPIYQKCKEIWENSLGREHPDYLVLLTDIVNLYRFQGRYAQAQALCMSHLEILERVVGREHPDYAAVLNTLGYLYHSQGLYKKAEEAYTACRIIWEKTLGLDHLDYSKVLHNLANLYRAQGRYVEAESMYVVCLRIREKVLGREHLDYVSVLNNLGILYREQGRYAESEAIHNICREIREKALGRQHLDYVGTLNSLGTLYHIQGRYAEAEAVFLSCREIWGKVLGREHIYYAGILNNLGLVYWGQKRYAEAEAVYQICREIRERVLGREHPDYALVLNNLGLLYRDQGRYAEAESMLVACRAIREKILGVMHPDYAVTLASLGEVYRLQKRYKEAEQLLTACLDIREKILGENHYKYALSVIYLAQLYSEYGGDYGRADSLWRRWVGLVFRRIQREFPALPTAHRQQFMENVFSGDLVLFQQYVAQRGASAKDVLRLGYLVARGVKGLLLTSSEGMRYSVETSVDTAIKRLYAEWRSVAEQYAFYLTREDYASADSVYRILNERERSLVERLPELRAFFPDLEKEPLYPSLKRGEVVIEAVRVPMQENSDSILYFFYMVSRQKRGYSLDLYIQAVDTSWERRAIAAYDILRSPYAEVSKAAYRLLWAWVDSVLPEGTERVHFSPDGIYYRVNVGSLYDGLGYVMDRYEVRYISSSRRLLIKRGRQPRSSAPVVIGNPAFYDTGRKVEGRQVRSLRNFPYGIPPLPGAELEAQHIAEALGVEPLVGNSATEERVKSLCSPRVLHIATHGYFSDAGRYLYANAGLLLAGSGVWDSVYAPLGVEDGKLTAREVLGMNLIGTELVVLSACETGLGEVRGEGLYGLSRAFLEAGAQAVISALWQVDDEATRELMERFYQAWVKRGKRSVEEVWRAVVRDFRRKYPLPYYWGAFIVMR